MRIRLSSFLVARERKQWPPSRHLPAYSHRPAKQTTWVIKDRVFSRIKTRFGHLAGNRHADRVADTLAQGASRRFDAGSLMEFRVTGGLAAQGPELLEFIQREVEARKVEPAIKNTYCRVLRRGRSGRDSTNGGAPGLRKAHDRKEQRQFPRSPMVSPGDRKS